MALSRRQFCGAIGAGMVASVGIREDDRQQEALRVIAYNVYGGTGWPKNRPRAQRATAKGQMARRLALELALHEPDIINFSESPSERTTKQIAEILEMDHVRFPSAESWPGTLMSRFKIVDSENVPLDGGRPKELFTRHWGRGTIELPNGDMLIVHSAHLFPTGDPIIRLREIQAMVSSMKPDMDDGRSMLLIGDLNHGPDTEEYEKWMDAGWVDTFAKVGIGDGNTMNSEVPKWRIDYIMAVGPIAERVSESRPLFEGAFRLNRDDKEAFALSDHLPQLAVFE